jgi:CRISPR-associated exonuclease Cas4
LIHVDGLWSENRFTVEGRHLHENVDFGGSSTRANVTIARGLRIRSLQHGIVGRADAVEFTIGGQPRPIEYKRGRPKALHADRVQLCAQGLCLEEMLDTEVGEGEIFYGRTRRRELVIMSQALRRKTMETIDAVRSLLDGGVTPRTDYERRKCDRCSMKDLCLPKGTGPSRRASRYMARALEATITHTGLERRVE